MPRRTGWHRTSSYSAQTAQTARNKIFRRLWIVILFKVFLAISERLMSSLSLSLFNSVFFFFIISLYLSRYIFPTLSFIYLTFLCHPIATERASASSSFQLHSLWIHVHLYIYTTGHILCTSHFSRIAWNSGVILSMISSGIQATISNFFE